MSSPFKFRETAMRKLSYFLILWMALITSCLTHEQCFAQENWTRFRGDNGSGLALNSQLPLRWTEKDYAWEINLPGVGSSSPVVWGDRIFLTSANPETAELTILCLSTKDGSELWQQKYASAKHKQHRNNDFASSTLAVDKNYVYAAFANDENTWLLALDHDGDEQWKRNFGPYISMHGFGTSPIVHGNKVFLLDSQQAKEMKPDQQPGESRIIALNAADGSDAWTTPFEDNRACYGVPCIFKMTNGKELLIGVNTVKGYFGVDVENGHVEWTTPTSFDKRIVASPVIAGGMIFDTAGSGGGGNYLVAIRPDADSVENPPQEVYRIQKASYVPSPIAVGDLIFMFGDKGIVSCHDLATGAEHFRKRIAKGFSGSPVANSNNVYCIAENGDVHVVVAAKDFEHHIATSLNEPSRSTPAIVGNRMYLRTESKLFAIDREGD